MRSILLVLALASALPGAAAVDLLATEVSLGDEEARILVRSTTGSVRVTTEPPVLAAGVAPGAFAETGQLASTPATLDARHVWRGIEGIVEVVLVRPGGDAVQVFLEDDAGAGLWIDWPAPRAIPFPGLLVPIAIAIVARARHAS